MKNCLREGYDRAYLPVAERCKAAGMAETVAAIRTEREHTAGSPAGKKYRKGGEPSVGGDSAGQPGRRHEKQYGKTYEKEQDRENHIHLPCRIAVLIRTLKIFRAGTHTTGHPRGIAVAQSVRKGCDAGYGKQAGGCGGIYLQGIHGFKGLRFGDT